MSNNDKVLDIKIYGSDNAPLSASLEECSCKIEDKDSNLKEQIPEIFTKFCDGFDFKDTDGKLIVGRRKDEELKEEDCQIYRVFNGEIYFGNLVGTVRREYSLDDFKKEYGNILNNAGNKLRKDQANKVIITIEIRSRFDNKDKPFFLLDMLTQGNLVFSNDSIPSNDRESIFDCLLLWQMKKNLLRAYEKGVFRAYNTFHENGSKVKGSIDFARHIKLNAGLNNGNISYTYREKSADNYLNHLILLAYNHLKKKYYKAVVENLDGDYEVSQVLNLLYNETGYPKYGKGFIIRKCETPIAHPYYTEYEELRQTCLAILRDEGISLFSGMGEKTQGILYYIPDLWEEYLESKLTGVSLKSQKTIPIFSKEDKSASKYHYKYKSRPDYIFYARVNGEESPFMILDAKFIPRWFYQGHCQGKISNLIGDHDKCVRDKNSLDVLSTGTIFPFGPGDKKCAAELGYKDDASLKTMSEEESDVDEAVKNKENYSIKAHKISEYNNNSTFYTIPIYVPDVNLESQKNNSYNEWKKDFDHQFKDSFLQLKRMIDLEKKKYEVYAGMRAELTDRLKEIESDNSDRSFRNKK